MNSISVQKYHGIDEIACMQQEWDEFMESVSAEIQFSFDWCRLWFNYYGVNRHPLFYIFKRNNSICGILPLFFENLWVGPFRVGVLKIIGSDFLPITLSIPVQHDVIPDVIEIFLNEIGNSKFNWDLLLLGPICGRYDSLTVLEEAFKKYNGNKYNIWCNQAGVQTYIKLAENWDDQLATLPKNHRKEIKRKYDRLLNDGNAIEAVYADNDNFDNIFDEFVITHQKYWNNKNRPGHFGAWPKAREFHRDIALKQLKLNRLRLYQLNVNGNCIGYKYLYKFGATYYCFLYGRKGVEHKDKYDFARIDFGVSVKHAIEENVKWLDLMRGEYEQKKQLGGQLYPVRQLFVIKKRLPSVLRFRIVHYCAYLYDICYYKIWRARIAPLIKYKLGPFNKVWIKTNILVRN
jgi:hypothetical protein